MWEERSNLGPAQALASRQGRVTKRRASRRRRNGADQGTVPVVETPTRGATGYPSRYWGAPALSSGATLSTLFSPPKLSGSRSVPAQETHSWSSSTNL